MPSWPNNTPPTGARLLLVTTALLLAAVLSVVLAPGHSRPVVHRIVAASATHRAPAGVQLATAPVPDYPPHPRPVSRSECLRRPVRGRPAIAAE